MSPIDNLCGGTSLLPSCPTLGQNIGPYLLPYRTVFAVARDAEGSRPILYDILRRGKAAIGALARSWWRSTEWVALLPFSGATVVVQNASRGSSVMPYRSRDLPSTKRDTRCPSLCAVHHLSDTRRTNTSLQTRKSACLLLRMVFASSGNFIPPFTVGRR